ncbi:MAG: sulfotransferase domain-containing protein, partial [Planctomycetota bacterium]
RQNWRHLWHYRARGFYCDQIQRYLSLFDRSQIRIYLFDDLKQDPQALIRDIFGFLGVDDTFVPDTSGKYNATGIPKSRTLFRLIMRPNPIKSAIKPLLPERLRKRVKTFVTANPWSLRRPPLPAEVRRELVQGYRADILRLQNLLGRDLSAWLT